MIREYVSLVKDHLQMRNNLKYNTDTEKKHSK